MIRRLAPFIALLCLGLPGSAKAIHIVFDYRFDSGFFADPARREVLEQAARHYEARIDGELGALPPEGWIAAFPDPSRGEMLSLDDLDVPTDTIIVFVGARPLAQQKRLAMGGPGNLRLPCQLLGPESCLLALSDEQSLSQVSSWVLRFPFRERLPALRFPALGFAPWGGSLSFADDIPWYFGLDPDVPGDRFDFLSSAVHELGHVLGIGTAESWGTRTPAGAFEGPESALEHDGAVPLHSDLAHWADATRGRANGRMQPAAFTRGLAPGERKLLTELDVTALLDIGWQRSEVTASLPGANPLYVGRIKGDVDGDGQLTEADLLPVDRFLHSAEIFAGVDLDQADVAPVSEEGSFGDGVIDWQDHALLAAAKRWTSDPYLEHQWIPLPCIEPLPPILIRLPDGQCALLLFSFGPEDYDAFRLLGWEAPEWPDDPLPGVREGPPLKGDLHEDGVIDGRDLHLLELFLSQDLRADHRAFHAADVAPAIEGNSIGDGVVDEADLALLRAALVDPDIDGDGLDTQMENELNLLWMSVVGRPRYGPLLRWTDECLEPLARDGVPPLISWLLFEGELGFDFCSRNGTPWSLTPGISPEQFLEQVGERAARRPDPGRSQAAPARAQRGIGSASPVLASDLGSPVVAWRLALAGAVEAEASREEGQANHSPAREIARDGGGFESKADPPGAAGVAEPATWAETPLVEERRTELPRGQPPAPHRTSAAPAPTAVSGPAARHGSGLDFELAAWLEQLITWVWKGARYLLSCLASWLGLS